MPQSTTPVETVVAPASTTEQITGLPTDVPVQPQAGAGTIADLLQQKRITKAEAKEVTPEPAPAKKPKDKAPKLNPEELDAALKNALFKPRNKPDDNQPVVEPATDPAKEVVEPAAVEPTPAPAKKVTKTVTVKSKSDELAEKLAELEKQRLELEKERLAQEREKLNQSKSQPQSKIVPPKELSDDERYELEVFQSMAKMDAKKYGDLPDRFVRVAQATAARKSKWEKDHPGEVFDPNDSEHDEFFTANRVDYDKRDFRRAESLLANEGHSDPRIEELKNENKQIKAQQRSKDLETVAHKAFLKYGGMMVEGVDPDIAKLLGKTPEKLLEEYPFEGEEIMQAGQALEILAKEAYLILDETGLFEPKTTNPAHNRIIGLIQQYEAEIPTRSKEDRQDAQGREFATWDKWVTLSPQQQANYWHLGPEEVVDIVSHEFTEQIKAKLEKFNKAAEAKLKRSGRSSAPVVPVPELKETRSPAVSPGSSGRVTQATPARSNAGGNDKLTKIITTALFNRRA